jgi:6-phosphogluconolactonase
MIGHDNLTLLEPNVSSGGDFPVSLRVHQPLLYVINSGGDGNITGFTFGHTGHLTPLTGSIRWLNAGGMNPPNFLNSSVTQ